MLKVSSIMSGVTVSSVTFLLMPALFISRFRPPAPTLDSTNFLASSIVFISLTSVNTTRKKLSLEKIVLKKLTFLYAVKFLKFGYFECDRKKNRKLKYNSFWYKWTITLLSIIYPISPKDICISPAVHYKTKIKINLTKFHDCYGGV